MKKSLWILVVAGILLTVIIFLSVKTVQQVTVQNTTGALPSSDYKTTTMAMGQGIYATNFATEIADTPALQELGLSFRSGIDQNRAMLFMFPTEGNYKFWMKDMNFPIDIIWLNSEKKIIYIEKNLSPQTYPNAFGPNINSRYVVEVASGTADRLGLLVGTSVFFNI